MKYTNVKSLGDAGEYLFGHLIAYYHKCIYRISSIDIGIDGEIELIENETSTGQLIKVQIRTTDDSDFSKQQTLYSIDKAHLEYWNKLSLPVLLCRVFLKSQKVYCLKINQETKVKQRKNSNEVNIDFSSSTLIIDANFIHQLKEYAIRRNSNLTMVFKKINNLKQKAENIPQYNDSRLLDPNEDYLNQIELIREEILTIQQTLKGLGAMEQFPIVSEDLNNIYRQISASEKILLTAD